MSTAVAADQLPLTQTMGLLDCMDTVRQQELVTVPSPETPVKDPAVLRAHLKKVCDRLSQPLSAEQADKVVTLYLDKTAGRTQTPSPLLPNRPANPEDWQRQIQDLDRQINRAATQAKHWREHILGADLSVCFGVLVMVAVLAGLGKLLSATNPGGPLDNWHLGFITLVSCSLLAGLGGLVNSPWWTNRAARLGQTLKELRQRRDGLRDIKLDSRPTQKTMKDWLRAPGTAAAFYQIHVSGVPMLEQDMLAFKQAIEHHNETLAQRRAEEQQRKEDEARLVREREWDKGFEALALTHLDPATIA